jgi:hypothetical protein
LAALADELKSRLAMTLNSAQLEELTLRIHWIEDLANERYFELANLTGAEVRHTVRLHALPADLIAEDLIRSREVSDAERALRERNFEAAIRESLGPAKGDDLKLTLLLSLQQCIRDV